MRRRPRWIALLAALGAGAVAASFSAASAQAASYTTAPILNVSGACAGQNAESEQTAAGSYVYEIWMGCGGIGFARSTNGGAGFGAPVALPGSSGPGVSTWDPAVAVGPSGTVYAAYMVQVNNGPQYPVVAASFDDGATFPQVTRLLPPQKKDFGDRDFIAVGPDGSVYVTWDYGPQRSHVKYICSKAGSCSFSSGDLNVVLQRSTDGGRTFGSMTYVSPGFPSGGADSGPLVVEPGGRLDVLYQGYQITDPNTLTFGPGYEFFTASSNGGATWTPPVKVGAGAGSMSTAEWWIDGDIGIDAGGNLYATWDTQASSPAADTGWLSYSTDHGQHWATPLQAPADSLNVPHIVQVAGGGSGTAFVGWLSDSNPAGYAMYLRAFSIAGGWLSAPVQISSQFGMSSVWPGDTFGISTLTPTGLFLSWGSATPTTAGNSEIFATGVAVQLP